MPSALSVVQYCSMLFSIVQYCDLLNAKRQKACKGTTKNAHTQIFLEKNVFLDKNYAYMDRIEQSQQDCYPQRYNCVAKCKNETTNTIIAAYFLLLIISYSLVIL